MVGLSSAAVGDTLNPRPVVERGEPAAAHAVVALSHEVSNLEVNRLVQQHRARMVTKDDVDRADVVICMTKEHRQKLYRLFPSVRKLAKVRLLLPEDKDVADPLHQSLH